MIELRVSEAQHHVGSISTTTFACERAMSAHDGRDPLHPLYTDLQAKYSSRHDLPDSELLDEHYAYDRPVSPFEKNGQN